MSNFEENSLATMLGNILRYKWILIVPLLLTMIMVYSYTRDLEYYKSNATVSFRTEYLFTQGTRGGLSPFEGRVSLLVTSLKYGEQVKRIAKKVWPDLNDSQLEGKTRRLAGSKGIKLSFRKDNHRALVISYTADSPDIAYKVVQSVLEELIENSRYDTERRVKSTVEFLTSRMASLKVELVGIDQEILRLKNGLAPLVGAEAGVDLVTDISQDSLTPGIEKGLNQALKYKDSLPKLQFEKHVAEKELARMNEKLEKKEYVIQTVASIGSEPDYQADALFQEVQNSIIQKRKEIHLLTSQGYRNAHPKQRSVKAEIANLKTLLESRKKELSSKDTDEEIELSKLQAEAKLRTQILEKTEEISLIVDKIKVLESYQKEIVSKKNAIGSQLDSIAAQRTRIEELIQKKYAKTQAYNLAAGELEQVQQFGQASANDVGLRITVDEPPFLPENPVKFAHMSMYIMGLVLSLAFGMGLIFTLDSLDTSLVSPVELQAITGVPVIGSVDKFTTETKNQTTNMLKYGFFTAVLVLALLADYLLDFIPF